MKKPVERALKDYEDMLDLAHHVSVKKAQMPIADRAAQFSPFAAVVGHETAVKEAARVTDRKKELDEMEKAMVDQRLREIEAALPNGKPSEIVYFEQDQVKSGGRYISKVGKVKKIDVYERRLLMADGTSIGIDEIYKIE